MDQEPLDLEEFRRSRTLPAPEEAAEPADDSFYVASALHSLTGDLLPVPDLPPDAPREQVFEFAALAGLASAYGPDLVQNPAPYRQACAAYLARWHPESTPLS